MSGRIKREGALSPLDAMIKNAQGQVKVGEKDMRGFPRSLDYFVGGGKYAELFNQTFNKPTSIKITFPSDNADLVCREEYILRDNAGKLYAQGDGETFRVWSAKEDRYIYKDTNEIPDLMDRLEKATKTKFEVTLTLVFAILALRNVATFWKFTTKGDASTIPAIRDAFDAMLEQNGSVKGVIWDLSVKMHKSNTPGKSSRYPIVTICANESEQSIAEVKGYLADSPKLIG